MRFTGEGIDQHHRAVSMKGSGIGDTEEEGNASSHKQYTTQYPWAKERR